MNRRGRPYFDHLGGRSRGLPAQHSYQPSRDGFNQHRHHQQQSSNYWQDNSYRPVNDSQSYSSPPPWIPPNQGFNQSWPNHNQLYRNNIQTSFQTQHRSPAPPISTAHNVRPKKCFATSFQGSWGLPPPPPSLVPHLPLVAPINLPRANVNPPPGSKEAREKRLEESRERLVKSLKESKSETSPKETLITSTYTSNITEKSKPELHRSDDSQIKSKPASNLNTNTQERRSSLECISHAYSDSSKQTKPLPANKRVRSTSCSSNSSKKSGNRSPQRSKGEADSQIQDIKQQVIQQLLSLSQNKIQEIVSNPRSRKFEFVMKYMMKESRCEQSQKQRQIAQAGIVGTSLESTPDLVPLDYEKLLSDPDLAVNLSNLPAEMIETLGNIFNLKAEKRDVVDLDNSDDTMNVGDVLDSSDLRQSLPRTDRIYPIELNQSDSEVVAIADKTICFQHSSDNMFARQSDQIALIPMNKQPSLQCRMASPTLDFSLADHLEDVNADINLPYSANSFTDSVDMSSVFTALTHTAENLTDSLDQVQFQSIPRKGSPTMAAPEGKGNSTSEEYEERNSEFSILPFHEDLSSLPIFEPIKETPVCLEAGRIELPVNLKPTTNPLVMPAVSNISSSQSLTQDQSDDVTVPCSKPVIQSLSTEILDSPNSLHDKITVPEKTEIPFQTTFVGNQDMTEALSATLLESSCQPIIMYPNNTDTVNADPINTDTVNVNADLINTDAVDADPINSVTVNADPINTDTVNVNADPINTDAGNVDPINSVTVNADPINTDTVNADPINSNTVDADPVNSDTVNADPINTDTVNADPINTVTVNADPINTVTVNADPINNDATNMDPINEDSVITGFNGRENIGGNLINDDPINNNPITNVLSNNSDLVNMDVKTDDLINTESENKECGHISPSSEDRTVNESINSGPGKDSDKFHEISASVDKDVIEPDSRPMVMIEQSLLDQVNISFDDNFGNNAQTPPSNNELPCSSNSDNSPSLKGVVKLEVEDLCEMAVSVSSDQPPNQPAVEVSTQTKIPFHAMESSSRDLQSTLCRIENLCQDHGLQPAFEQLKLFLNAGDVGSDVVPSKKTRQTIQPKHRVLPQCSGKRNTTSPQAASTSLPVMELVDSLQSILGEIANVAIPQDRLKLIFKKITEIETQIESWTEIKKKLYEQVNRILRDEHSASSSQEDNDDAGLTRTKKPVPATRGITGKLDSVKVNSKPSESLPTSPAKLVSPTLSVSAVSDASDDDCKELPVRSPKKKVRRRTGPFGSKRRKVSTSPKVKSSPVVNISQKSTATQHTLQPTSPECSSRNRTLTGASPASSLRSRRVEAVIDSPPVKSPLRKTKAELKQMVHDPIEAEPLPSPRRTRTSVTTTETLEELTFTGRRRTRQCSASEESTPSPEKARPKPLTGEKLPRMETSTRSKRNLDKVDSECRDVYTNMMKSCSVVLQPLEERAKRPRLSVKKDLFEPRVSKVTNLEKEKPLDPLKDEDDSSSDDDVPLLALSKAGRMPSKEDFTDVPPLSTIDIWLVREDIDQNSVSSCDTGGTSTEPRTEDGDSTPATNFHSRSKRKKSKKSKCKGEDGDQSEHQSSKLDHLIFTDHPRGAILEIKVVNRQVLAASEEGVIFSYSIKSGKLKKTYTGHSAAVTCFCIIDDEEDDDLHRLITGSLDDYSHSYMIKSTEQSHAPLKVGAAVSIDQKWGFIFIGTKLGEVARIDAKTFSLLNEHMKFSQEAILALKATKEGPRRVLIVGTRNQAITVRDAETGLLLRSVSGFGQLTVYSLLLHKALVYCGTMRGNIPVFDFTSGHETCQFIAGNGVRCLKIYYGLLFAGCYDGFIYVFNVNDQRLITKIPGSGKMILCMDIAKNKIIFSCKDSFQALNFPPDVCQALKDAKSK